MTEIIRTAEELAHLTGATLLGDGKTVVKGVADLESASSSQVSFFSNPRYAPLLSKTAADVIFVPENTPLIEGKTFLVHSDPSAAFQKVLEVFCDKLYLPSGFQENIHPSAVIHSSAEIHPSAKIGPGCVVDQECKVGSGTVLEAQVFLGAGAHIGENCRFHPQVVIREGCRIGNRVILQSGVVIGSCGFGFTTTKEGTHEKQKQYGNVIIEDDVEIGANSTLDRGRFNPTLIKKGTKIDNLVMIAHGVEIGEHNLIIAQSGIAGSSKTGRNVVFAAQSGMAGHLRVGNFAQIAGRGGVLKNIPDGFKQYGGMPAQPLGDHQKNQVLIRNLSKFVNQLKEVKERVEKLEKKT